MRYLSGVRHQMLHLPRGVYLLKSARGDCRLGFPGPQNQQPQGHFRYFLQEVLSNKSVLQIVNLK